MTAIINLGLHPSREVSGVMEADTISKNWRKSKCQTSRGNFLKLIVFFIAIYTSLSAWGQPISWEKLKNSATKGDKEAQSIVGGIYRYGSDVYFEWDAYSLDVKVDKDIEQAIYWLTKAAEQNHVKAQHELGLIHLKIKKDGNTALYWCEKALQQCKNDGKELWELWICSSIEIDIDELKSKGYSSARANINSSTTSPSTQKTTLYLSTSVSSVNFSASGGTREITVNTNDNDWSCSQVSDWCTLTQSGNTIRLVCDANNSNARNDYFLVYYGERGADGKRTQNVRVNVTQDAGIKTPSAEIERIWIDHNATEWYQNTYYPFNSYSVKGMKIHIKFSVNDMLNKQGTVSAWIYYDNGDKLILTAHNGAYTTSDKQVSVADSFTPTYVNAIYNDFVLFLPNNAIPNLGKGSHNLKFCVGIHHGSNQIAISEFQSFTMSW